MVPGPFAFRGLEAWGVRPKPVQRIFATGAGPSGTCQRPPILLAPWTEPRSIRLRSAFGVSPHALAATGSGTSDVS
jgi:hypothetical protein